MTEVFGVGPVVAAMVIGDIRDMSRFASRDRFAAYNGTAPIEVSSGNRIIYRLSRRGNRRLNHAIHMAAVTQIRYRHSEGRAYYDKKLAEGKTPKEALRALKRQISDAIYPHLRPTPPAPPRGRAREGTRGTTLLQRGRLTPRTPALRPSHSRTCHHPTTPGWPRKRASARATPFPPPPPPPHFPKKDRPEPLDTKRHRYVGGRSFCGGERGRPNERSARVDAELVHAARLDATVVTG